MLALVLANLEDRHDPRMVQVGGRLGLGMEALHVCVVGELTGEDHLERDCPVEAHLTGPEHHAHAAAGDLAEDFVVAEVADAGKFGCAGRGRRILLEQGARGLIVPESRTGGRRHGSVFVNRAGLRARDEGSGGRPRGDCGRLGRYELTLESFEFGTQCRPAVVGNIDKVILDAPPSSLLMVGLEVPADAINATGQVDGQAAEVLAGSVAHPVSVLYG